MTPDRLVKLNNWCKVHCKDCMYNYRGTCNFKREPKNKTKVKCLNFHPKSTERVRLEQLKEELEQIWKGYLDKDGIRIFPDGSGFSFCIDAEESYIEFDNQNKCISYQYAGWDDYKSDVTINMEINSRIQKTLKELRWTE